MRSGRAATSSRVRPDARANRVLQAWQRSPVAPSAIGADTPWENADKALVGSPDDGAAGLDAPPQAHEPDDPAAAFHRIGVAGVAPGGGRGWTRRTLKVRLLPEHALRRDARDERAA
jgi:hypothetical protein